MSEESKFYMITISLNRNKQLLERLKNKISYRNFYLIKVSETKEKFYLYVITDNFIENEELKKEKDVNHSVVKEIKQNGLHQAMKYLVNQ